MKIFRNIILFIALLGLNSCIEKNKKKEVGSKIEIKGFEFIEDFELNKSLFNEETFEADSYNNYDGKLKVFHSKEKNYIVLDFVLIGSDHNLYLTYWTNKKLKIKFSKSTVSYLNKENTFKEKNQTYAEITEMITSYLSHTDSSVKLYDSQKNEVLDLNKVNEQKKQTKTFFYELIEPTALSIHAIVNDL